MRTLTLKRDDYRSDGIFSKLSEGDKAVCVTLEHAYPAASLGAVLHAYPTDFISSPHAWLPKVAPGQYLCQRGNHRLHSMTQDFSTFEVQGVKGHSGILFHRGAWNADSEGCIIVGQAVVKTPEDRDHLDGPDEIVTNSRATFDRFSLLMSGVDQFNLIVEG